MIWQFFGNKSLWETRRENFHWTSETKGEKQEEERGTIFFFFIKSIYIVARRCYENFRLKYEDTLKKCYYGKKEREKTKALIIYSLIILHLLFSNLIYYLI